MTSHSSITGKTILGTIRQQLNLSDYRKKHWEGSFEDYLDIVHEHPEVTRTAYQRLYDMILSHGTDEQYENKEKKKRSPAPLSPTPPPPATTTRSTASTASSCSSSTRSSPRPRVTAPN